MAFPSPGSKVVNGARTKIIIDDKVVAVSSISFNISNDVQPVVICGNPGPVELNYVGVAPVSGSITGWRIIGHGPFEETKYCRPENILNQPSVTLQVFDRQTGRPIAKIREVKITSWGTGYTARQQSEFTCHFMGLMYDDETTITDSPVDANTDTQLP